MRDQTIGSVHLQAADGVIHSLFHGDLIGRLWSASVQLNDARISECHAMVSLRGRNWKILALRGRFLVNGKPATESTLFAGQRLTFAPGLELVVSSVHLPRFVVSLGAEGSTPRVIEGVTSLYGGGRLVAGWKPDADAHVWPTGDGWMRSGVPPEPIGGGSRFCVAETWFEVSLVEAEPRENATLRDEQALLPLTIVARFDTVHIQRKGHPVLVITGRSARIISELVTLGQPVAWEELARGFWNLSDRDVIRRRWDMQLLRLRNKLRISGIRSDLIRPDGTGLIELVLGPSDTVVDET